MAETNGNGLTFPRWMDGVDREIHRRTGGLSHRDLADYAYRDAWADEISERECADEVLSEEGFPL